MVSMSYEYNDGVELNGGNTAAEFLPESKTERSETGTQQANPIAVITSNNTSAIGRSRKTELFWLFQYMYIHSNVSGQRQRFVALVSKHNASWFPDEKAYQWCSLHVF